MGTFWDLDFGHMPNNLKGNFNSRLLVGENVGMFFSKIQQNSHTVYRNFCFQVFSAVNTHLARGQMIATAEQ